MTQTVTCGVAPGLARAVCVFVHGRGQSPEEMVGTVLARLDPGPVRFVLPRAPRGAWYDARAVDPLTDRTAAQLDEALAAIAAAAETARAECPGVPLVLAGFSQGACLAVEYLMRGGAADAAAILTGCRVGASDEGLPRRDLHRLPVYAACGDADSWIPLWAFQKALGDLAASGARLRADILPGRAHDVSATEGAELSRLLAALASGAPALEGAA